jgi:hypothetical protein
MGAPSVMIEISCMATTASRSLARTGRSVKACALSLMSSRERPRGAVGMRAVPASPGETADRQPAHADVKLE